MFIAEKFCNASGHCANILNVYPSEWKADYIVPASESLAEHPNSTSSGTVSSDPPELCHLEPTLRSEGDAVLRSGPPNRRAQPRSTQAASQKVTDVLTQASAQPRQAPEENLETSHRVQQEAEGNCFALQYSSAEDDAPVADPEKGKSMEGATCDPGPVLSTATASRKFSVEASEASRSSGVSSRCCWTTFMSIQPAGMYCSCLRHVSIL